LSKKETQAWIRTVFSEQIGQMESFSQKSWGTAYSAVAKVRIVLQIGKIFKMSTNFACHHVSVGSFIDRDTSDKEITFHQLGSYINGQSEGTWKNKLTWLFAVHDFLRRTEGAVEESIGKELYEVRQAMDIWGVFPLTYGHFLPAGDPRTNFHITPIRRLINHHMGGPK
jgi:hypothetical protein